MNEFKFKFIYNGEDSFLNLVDNIRFNTKADSVGRYWKGEVKIDDKNFKMSRDFYIIEILFEIVNRLGDKKNIPIEMNLYS